MVFGSLGCMNNTDFGGKKVNDKCVRYVYYLSEITTGSSNLQILYLYP